MMDTTKLLSLFAIAGMALTSLLVSAGPAAAQSAQPCSSRYQLAWEMPLRAGDVGQPLARVLERPEFNSVRVRSLSRTSIARGPDGRVALRMNVPRGENVLNAFFLDPLGDPGVDAACLSLMVFFPNGFEWSDKGMKMGWGLWGGIRPSNISGGALPNQQEGWSVRNVNGQWGFRLYSYNLNRPGRHGQYSQHGARWMSSQWGTGRWHKIEMEVVMNTPGRDDGYAQVWLDGGDRRVMNNLRFRNDARWAIRGLMFADMWGGTTSDPGHFSPRNQEMWYADYRLYTPGGSAVARQSNPQGNTSTGSASGGTSPAPVPASNPPPGGGAFGAVAPSGGIGGQNVVVRWNPDSRADRYYVKVINRASRNTVFGGTALPNRTCSGGSCSLGLGNLPRGAYEWMVRPVYGSRAGSYSRMPFDVVDASRVAGSGQPTATAQSGPSSGNPPGGGAFGAIAPSGTVGSGSVVVSWVPDPDADKYFVKVNTDRDSWSDVDTVFAGSAWPRHCSGSRCSLDLGNLPRDSYEWMVRPVYGSRAGSYSRRTFVVR